MEKLSLALSALALVVLAWNTWTLSSLGERVEALESGGSKARTEAPRGFDPKPPMRLPSRAAAPPPAATRVALPGGAPSPEARDELVQAVTEEQERREREQSEQRAQRFQEDLLAELDAFAAETALAADKKQAVADELTYRSEMFRTTREDVRAGSISWLEARKEFETLRTESDDRLRNILGDEAFEALDVRLWGERRGGPF